MSTKSTRDSFKILFMFVLVKKLLVGLGIPKKRYTVYSYIGNVFILHCHSLSIKSCIAITQRFVDPLE